MTGVVVYGFFLLSCLCDPNQSLEFANLINKYNNAKFYSVAMDKNVEPELIKKYFKKVGHNSELILEDTSTLGKKFKIEKAPFAIVLKNDQIVYQGPIISERKGVELHTLAMALDDIKNNKKINISHAEGVGCAINPGQVEWQ